MVELNCDLGTYGEHNNDIGNCYINGDFVDTEEIEIEIKEINLKIAEIENRFLFKLVTKFKNLLRLKLRIKIAVTLK